MTQPQPANRYTMPSPNNNSHLIPPSGPLHYHWIPQDHGGTYKHTTTTTTTLTTTPPPSIPDRRSLPPNLPAIGTQQCLTCVGVHLKLSPTTHFVAHINATHMRPNWHRSACATDPYANRIVTTEAEGAYVRAEVMRRLERKSARCAWPRVEEITELTLVCPMLHYRGEDLSGKHVVQGIRDFCRRPRVIVDEESEGFVVRFSTGCVTLFPVRQDYGDKKRGAPLLDDDVHYVGHIFHGN